MGVTPYSYALNTLVLILRYQFSRFIWCKKQAFTVFLLLTKVFYIQVQTQITFSRSHDTSLTAVLSRVMEPFAYRRRVNKVSH